jgi:hypothetical protein
MTGVFVLFFVIYIVSLVLRYVFYYGDGTWRE